MPIEDVITAVHDHRDRAPSYDLYRDYDEGRHKYPFATDAFRKDYDWVLRNARENMCPTVIHSFTDLVEIQAWAGAGAKSANTVDETLQVRRALNLAVREAHRAGDAYVLSWPDSARVWRPWYHKASQVAYKVADDDPDEFAWVAKLWPDPATHRGRVNVYYPDRVERWVTWGKIRHDTKTAPDWPRTQTAYQAYSGDDGGPVLTHDRGRVPWVHLAFDANEQGGHGRSVLRDVVPIQDALNKSLADLIVGGEAFARPLRALMDYKPDVRINPQTGRPEETRLDYDPTKQSILGIPGKGPLQQLDPPDATRLIAVQEAFAGKIARVVGIPVTDIIPDLGNVPSGAALRVLANRRTNAVRDFNTDNTHAVADLMALLGVSDAYPEWVDPAPSDETERVEIATAKRDLGYPLEEVLPALGEDPDDIARIVGATAAEAANVGRLAREAFNQGRDPADVTNDSTRSATEVKARADAMGVLIRAGVDPEDAANKVGLDVDFTGATPTSLRLPESDAQTMEAK